MPITGAQKSGRVRIVRRPHGVVTARLQQLHLSLEGIGASLQSEDGYAVVKEIVPGMAADKDGQIRIAKVNIDDNPMTPTKYGVRGIPTLMLFKNGEISATKVGAAPKSKLYEWVEEAL